MTDLEQRRIDNFHAMMIDDVLWCENMYQDNDPYDEPLIRLVSGAIRDKYVNYLHIILSHIPKHKIDVINDFLYARVSSLYIEKDSIEYLLFSQQKFSYHLQKEKFIDNVYKEVLALNDLSKLQSVEKYIDANFTVGTRTYSEQINSYLLHQNLQKNLKDKTSSQKIKI